MGGRTYRFGEFEIDEARLELRRSGTPVALQRKAFDLLLHLVRNRERVVSHEEIYAELWPDVAISEDSLHKAVSGARRAVGDAGRRQGVIQTLRGRGLRFVAPVACGDEAAAERGAAPLDRESDFVGRDDVLAAAIEAVAAARTGRGAVLLIAGEPGIGKTRTVQEVASRCRRRGERVLTGWCPEGGGASSLWPWLRMLRPLLESGDLPALAGKLGDGILDLAKRFPSLRGGLPARAAAPPQDPRQARFRTFEAIAGLLRRAAGEAPLLVVLDDFHWADPDSLALLDFLAREIRESRLVLVVAYRIDDLAPGHPLLEVVRRPECRCFTLAGLTRDEVARLVESQLGEPADEGTTATIHERTGGNPFFVKELIRSLPAGRKVVPAAVVAAPLPSAIREVLALRLEVLSAECREVLALGAVVGREFPLSLIARVSGTAPDRLLELLDRARSARVLDQVGVVSRFAHALFREALLEAVPADRLASLHWQVGEALEALYAGSGESHLAELARHFTAGAPRGDVAKAIAYARRVGDAAAALLASDEAAEHYGRALDLVGMLARPDERLRCDLLIAFGEAEIGAGRTADGRATLREAAALAHRLELPEQVARAALASGGLVLSTEVGLEDPALVRLLEDALARLPAEPSSLRVRLLVRLALALVWSGELARARALIAEALATAERLGDPVALGQALYVHRWDLFGPADLDDRIAVSDRLLSLALGSEQRELELAARSCRFLDLLEGGHLPAALRELAQYERIADEFGIPRYRWRARFYRVTCLLLEGRFAEAEERAGRVLAEEERFGPRDAGLVFGAQLATLRYEQDRLGELEPVLRDLADRFPAMPIWGGVHAIALVETGREAEAREAFETAAAADFANLPGYFGRLLSLVVLAEVCSSLGDRARARRLYELLAPLSPRTVVVGAGAACWGAVDLFIGRLAATAGEPERAALHFGAAREMNTRIGARPWLAWSEYETARILAARGGAKREPAAQHLGRAREIAAALAMTRLERHASGVATVLS
jgi:DNA-binding winged helix-turn-helix (wHTH) protein/ATP/maltotriose-dependent transcriptional regulator MalT